MKRLYVVLSLVLMSLSTFAQEITDSVGLYAVTAAGLEKVRPIKYTQIKTSNRLFKITTKLIFDRAKSNLEFYSHKAVFRLYFAEPEPGSPSDLQMFSPSHGIDEFKVVEFEQKDDHRVLTVLSASVNGAETCVEEAEKVSVRTKRIKRGVYEMTIYGVPGQYGITYSDAAIRLGYDYIYDFSFMCR